VSQLCRGRIVWVELLDPQGRNRKYRPALVVSPDVNIRDDGEVWVVAISS
jgi:mRNA-degrading endonuclease toxin of MazEF toxin-antitoxin module